MHRIPRAVCLVVTAVTLCVLHAQAAGSLTQAGTIKEFFHNLAENYDPAHLPKFQDVLRIADLVHSSDPKEVSEALPSILVALESPSDDVKMDAAYILMIVAQRPDGLTLLKSYSPSIGNLLGSPNPRLQNGAVAIFGFLKPAPPQEAVPMLLAYVRRPDGDSLSQASAIATLLKTASQNSDVIETTQYFLSQHVGRQTKEAVLNGIANSRAKDPRLTQLVVEAVDDKDSGIRLTAVQALTRMGKEAILQGQAALQRVLNRSGESPEVKSAAERALRAGGPGNENEHE